MISSKILKNIAIQRKFDLCKSHMFVDVLITEKKMIFIRFYEFQVEGYFLSLIKSVYGVFGRVFCMPNISHYMRFANIKLSQNGNALLNFAFLPLL